jgi:hypothetical protein
VKIASYEAAVAREYPRSVPAERRGSLRPVAEVAGAGALVTTMACILWLASGVHPGEIARFVPYELGFVLLPGWLVYRVVVPRADGRLRQLVLGWSLGYLLEVLAFIATAVANLRGLFVLYPVVVGIPAAFIARRRGRARRAVEAAPTSRRTISYASLGVGALLCAVLLLYAAAVGFSQTPLPRAISATTYQEDTVFTISVAAEALHHWPVTLPMVAGQPLHYHLFAFLHMAAVSQVTGIDLSVVVMRLYMIPLLLLFGLQLVLLGRRVGRSLSVGFLAAGLILFSGELDVSRTTRFLFDDSFFYWLLSSHTFLLGLVFFVPTILVLGDLVTSDGRSQRGRMGMWLLLTGFLVGCIGAKSYALLEIPAGLGLFVLWQAWRKRTVNRPAVFALALSAGIYLLTNALIFRWNSAGVVVSPFKTIRKMQGVEQLGTLFGHLWGNAHVPAVVGVPYGIFGLIGIPLVGIALLLRYRRLALSSAEAWLLSLFVAALPVLILLSQPGRGQLFLFYFGVVPGTILAAAGYSLFWTQHGRASFVSRPTLKRALPVAAVGSLLVLGLLNTPLDWFPRLSARQKDSQSLEDQRLRGLTSGLYQGLLWIRHNTSTNAVLVVNNHSLHPDNHDSKYFYYSAFAQRRVLLESWDYTPQAAATGKFFLDAAHTPFPRRLALSDAIFRRADDTAIRTAARNYGATYLVVDKVHGWASPWLGSRVRGVYSNGDMDVYAITPPAPRESTCPSEQEAGISAVFGHRTTFAAAGALRRTAEGLGFPGLIIQRRGCGDYAALLVGLSNLAQAKDFQREVASRSRQVTLECRTYAPRGGLNAVFGHRSTRRAAQLLEARANAMGFSGLDVQQDTCGDWEVDLRGLRTAAQRREFRLEAAPRGFQIRFEPG